MAPMTPGSSQPGKAKPMSRRPVATTTWFAAIIQDRLSSIIAATGPGNQPTDGPGAYSPQQAVPKRRSIPASNASAISGSEAMRASSMALRLRTAPPTRPPNSSGTSSPMVVASTGFSSTSTT